MTEEKKEDKESPKYQLVEVPTQMGILIQTPGGEHITEAQALTEILNKLDEVKQVIG